MLSVLCGLLWGTFVFFLDRAFVSTMSKNSSWIIQLLSAIPRLSLALLVSVSISKPIEILFFHDRIVSQIQTNMQDDVNSYVATVEAEREVIDADIGNYRKKIGELNLEKKGPDQEEGKMLAAFSDCNQSNTGNQNTINAIVQGINSQISDNETSLRRLENLVNKGPQDSANIKSLEGKITILRYGIPRGQSSGCSTLSQAYLNYHGSRLNKLDEAITATAKLCRDDSLKLHKLDSTKAKNVAVISKSDTISFSQNLSAQIEALNSLINTNNNSGKPNRRITEKAAGFWWYHFVIWMLFLAIEIAPISMKLIMPRGEYDEIAKAHYESVKYQCDTIVKKKEAALKEYFEQAKQENIDLLKDFFEKVRFHRTSLLDNTISDWSKGQAPYVELQRNIFKKLFDYEPDLDGPTSKHETASHQVSVNNTVKTEQSTFKTPSDAVVLEDEAQSPLESLKGSTLSFGTRVTKKIKEQMDDEITKTFFNAIRIIACVLLPAFIIKMAFPQDFDKLIDLIKKIKE